MIITTETSLLMLGDCLERMKELPDQSVDMILCDLPYGTTACKWDTIIPFEPLWEQYWRVCKPNAAVVLFGAEPFSSQLRNSQLKFYKYDWIWEKNKGGNIFNAKKQPMITHEVISVFYRSLPTYLPILEERAASGKLRVKSGKIKGGNIKDDAVYGKTNQIVATYGELKNPTSVKRFNVERGQHPTQKPTALLEYLIKTYTHSGEFVLDNTMGSGSTGVACVNADRRFIGIEKETTYFEIAERRIREAEAAQVKPQENVG